MNDIEVIINTNKFGHKTSFFKIRTNNKHIYMKVGNSFMGHMNNGEPEKIVIINSNNFLELWKNDPAKSERKLAFGNESIWRNDYKFHLLAKRSLSTYQRNR